MSSKHGTRRAHTRAKLVSYLSQDTIEFSLVAFTQQLQEIWAYLLLSFMPPVKSKGPKIAALLRLLATLFANSFPRHFGHLFTLVISQLSKDIYRSLFIPRNGKSY